MRNNAVNADGNGHEYTNEPYTIVEAATIERKTLVLDLDETLVHSALVCIGVADLAFTIAIDKVEYKIYTKIRPGVQEFLKQMSAIFEIMVFTASIPTYADAIIDKIDVNKVITSRYYRDSCFTSSVGYIKDLSKLGRNLAHVIIVDNAPESYSYQPDNAIPIRSWYSDSSDKELADISLLLQMLVVFKDVRPLIRRIKKLNTINYPKALKYLKYQISKPIPILAVPSQTKSPPSIANTNKLNSSSNKCLRITKLQNESPLPSRNMILSTYSAVKEPQHLFPKNSSLVNRKIIKTNLLESNCLSIFQLDLHNYTNSIHSIQRENTINSTRCITNNQLRMRPSTVHSRILAKDTAKFMHSPIPHKHRWL